MVFIALLCAAVLLLVASTVLFEAVAWLGRALVRSVVLGALLLTWLGYFLCFPRQAARAWAGAADRPATSAFPVFGTAE